MLKKPGFSQLHEPLNEQALEVMTRGGKPYAAPKGMPKRVKVQGQHFKVFYHSQIYTMDRVRLRGIVMFAQRLIIIDPTQTIHMMRETLYHEMAHIYLHNWQAKSPCLRKLSHQQVEELCDLFAEAHYDSRLNNPGPR